MKIQLNNWKIININFSLLDENTKREDNSFDLETGNFFTNNDPKAFGVGFKINIEDKAFNLQIEAVFNFSTNKDITDDFKLSSFPKANAPAIAFPYLRAFISNLVLQSGFEPVILPSINFIELSKK